jgi:hypothetical protein
MEIRKLRKNRQKETTQKMCIFALKKIHICSKKLNINWEKITQKYMHEKSSERMVDHTKCA